MTRTALSRPVVTALKDGIISESSSVLDFGCGKGGDVDRLHTLGFDANGWDPAHRPDGDKGPADVVNLGYVVNVIENQQERKTVLIEAWGLARRTLVVAGRTFSADREPVGIPHGDGLITARGTFQKLFTHTELAEWITEVTGMRPHAAAPGIFYLFREEEDARAFLRSRVAVYRPRVRIDPNVEFDLYRKVLEPLLEFMTQHARYPHVDELSGELSEGIAATVGSAQRALRIIRSVTPESYWEEVTRLRRRELLVMLALGRFRGLGLRSDPSTRRDVRYLFVSEKAAHREADRLLIASSDASVRYVNSLSSAAGRVSQTSLYVHTSALAQIPPVLRVFEGCARVLGGFHAETNLIRLSFAATEVEYRVYDDFDRNAHPQLLSSSTVSIGALDVQRRQYTDPSTRQVLHRKEEFMATGDPRRELYAALSRAEARRGLYDDPMSIRTADEWSKALHAKGLTVVGHRLKAAGRSDVVGRQ